MEGLFRENRILCVRIYKVCFSFSSFLIISATDSLHLLQIPVKNHVFPWVAGGTIRFDPRMLLNYWRALVFDWRASWHSAEVSTGGFPDHQIIRFQRTDDAQVNTTIRKYISSELCSATGYVDDLFMSKEMHIPNGGYRDNQHEWSTQDIYHIEKYALFYNGEYLTNE